MGRSDPKVGALERIHELILGPRLQELPALGDCALLLMPDHSPPSRLKTHSNEPVPFAILRSEELGPGTNESSGTETRRYTEAEAARTRVLVGAGHRLIEVLFGADLPVN